ncbi:hypothetical protein GRI35_10565 [Altererythrobacter aestiaquae]|uniref:Uncharacterized protein n=1 Tax=Pontixanthobacter aestiaquae TaxID=1509367 RepID=A0A844Z9D4_9SPHN|nr:hypothetical protein [Pontixanthobacter aestiaquae]
MGIAFAASSAPTVARDAEKASMCLLEKGGAEATAVFVNLGSKGFVPTAAQMSAFNRAMASCEKRHGWTREQTFDAGAHTGFVLRFRQVDSASRAAGMTASRRAVLLEGATLFHRGPALRKEWPQFNGWLNRHTGVRFADFRKTSEFAFFDAYLGVLSSAHRFENS